jgi:hypothetical protein
MALISKRHIKAWERFNDELERFLKDDIGEETYAGEITLYEDAFTTRNVRYFKMTEDGVLTWTEDEQFNQETMYDEDDAREWLKFWKSCLRKAKRYWNMDAIQLDRIQDGEVEDEED